MNDTTEPLGIVRVRAEIADLEAQQLDHRGLLLLDAKRRTLALLVRTHADLKTAQDRARARRTPRATSDTSHVAGREHAPAAPAPSRESAERAS
jgi:hypothetical protein